MAVSVGAAGIFQGRRIRLTTGKMRQNKGLDLLPCTKGERKRA
jgi:hypothetical protein